MGVFKLGKMTFGSLFKKPETVLYPFESKPQPTGLKGHIEVETDTCILCGLCEKSCPTDCISVDKGARTWQINPFGCIQCGYCVTVCPKDSLRMEPSYSSPNSGKVAVSIEIPAPAKDAAKAAPAKAQVADDAAAKQEKTVNLEKASGGAAAADGPAPEAAPRIDAELESKISLMDPAAAERVRAALAAR